MREEITGLLQRGAWEELTAKALQDKKILRTILKLLYHPDDYIHWLAAEAIGYYGAALAGTDPEKTRELVRRLLWNLNEECGASPWGSVEAIGAITVQRPDLFIHYVSILFPFHEDHSLCPGVIWTIAQVGRQQPASVSEYIPFLITELTHENASIRAYAAWALGSIGAWEAETDLAQLLGDSSFASIYDRSGRYETATVADIACKSLAVLQNLRSSPIL